MNTQEKKDLFNRLNEINQTTAHLNTCLSAVIQLYEVNNRMLKEKEQELKTLKMLQGIAFN